MSYFITSQKLTLQKPSEISDTDVAHILFSRRAKVGQMINIQDVKNIRYACKINGATKSSLTIIPERILDVPPESPLDLNLFQGYISEQALDLVIQKSTELGIYTLTVFNAQHSPQALKPQTISKKLERWRKISLEAAKQSDRLKPTTINFAQNLEQALNNFSGQLLVTDLATATTSIGRMKVSAKAPIGIIIGPEGGLAPEELKICHKKKATTINLGSRTLRAETAAISAISVLQARFGDLN